MSGQVPFLRVLRFRRPWRYDPAIGPDLEIVVAAESKESEIRRLRGRVLGRTMEMEVSGKSWYRPASFRPEEPLERRWKAVQSVMAPPGGGAAGN